MYTEPNTYVSLSITCGDQHMSLSFNGTTTPESADQMLSEMQAAINRAFAFAPQDAPSAINCTPQYEALPKRDQWSEHTQQIVSALNAQRSEIITHAQLLESMLESSQRSEIHLTNIHEMICENSDQLGSIDSHLENVETHALDSSDSLSDLGTQIAALNEALESDSSAYDQRSSMAQQFDSLFDIPESPVEDRDFSERWESFLDDFSGFDLSALND